jgi:hypothetical protein
MFSPHCMQICRMKDALAFPRMQFVYIGEIGWLKTQPICDVMDGLRLHMGLWLFRQNAKQREECVHA